MDSLPVIKEGTVGGVVGRGKPHRLIRNGGTMSVLEQGGREGMRCSNMEGEMSALEQGAVERIG